MGGGVAAVRVAVVTVSDTRTEADDEGGSVLADRLGAVGCTVTLRVIVKDDPAALRDVLDRVCREDLADALVSTGGTGIAPRDQTFEAVDALLEKRLDGFGEAFRRLSWDAVGPRAILSRAVAGTYRGRVIVALPGSPRAVRLAVDEVLGPVLPHAVALARGDAPRH